VASSVLEPPHLDIAQNHAQVKQHPFVPVVGHWPGAQFFLRLAEIK